MQKGCKVAGQAVQGLSVVEQDHGKDVFASYRQPRGDMARGKEDFLTLKEYLHMTAIFTPLGSSLLLGHWGCGPGLLWEERQAAGVKWSLVKCLKGMNDPGALIARGRQQAPGNPPKMLHGS